MSSPLISIERQVRSPAPTPRLDCCHRHSQEFAMSALIVGGDRIGTYRDFLAQQGFAPVRHWNGRKAGECHRSIPLDTRLVVLIVDQLNHGLARKVRRLAGQMAVPVVFSKRSLGQLDAALAGLAA